MSKGFREVSDDELDAAIAYAIKTYHLSLDRDLLRELTNKTIGAFRKNPNIAFPFTAAAVIRERLRAHTKAEDEKIQALKGAVTKIGNLRAQWKRRQKSPQPSVAATSASTQRFPLNERTGQYRLI